MTRYTCNICAKFSHHFQPKPCVIEIDTSHLKEPTNCPIGTDGKASWEKEHSQDCEMVRFGYSDCTCGFDNQ